jgi:hypothetical protein
MRAARKLANTPNITMANHRKAAARSTWDASLAATERTAAAMTTVNEAIGKRVSDDRGEP